MTPRPTAALLAAALALPLLGCAAPEPGGSGSAPGTGSAPASYSVRGVVRQLPSGARRSILVQHEAVPELVDMTGEVVGMDAMAMEFDVAAEVDLEALAPGDKIRFTLEVDWDAEPPAVIRVIERLPADTELEL